MSPVHVIVGEDERAEAMWSAAFTGAVDLYRFPRNVDAFERLTAAEAPIDLVVLTPAQHGPFNLTPDQFIARVLEGPLGQSRFLQNLHVIVVGSPVSRAHPRVMAVSTLDAAIRLVKFGEIERTPRPAVEPEPARPVANPRARRVDIDEIVGGSQFSNSIISRIWDAPDPAPTSPPAPAEPMSTPPSRTVEGGGGAAPASARAAEPVVPGAVVATGAAAPAQPQLFTRVSVPGLVVGSAAPVSPTSPSPTMHAPATPAAQLAPVAGGGAAVPVGAPGEAIEVATGLEPARPYQLPHGAGYRGPAVRSGHMHMAGHEVAGAAQPVPPALAAQVQSMVYGSMVGNPHDPVLVWSSSARQAQAAPVPGAPAPAQGGGQGQADSVVPLAAPVGVGMQPAAPRVVPMDPPAGAYAHPGVAVTAPVPAPATAAPAMAHDPFLARAEQGGGDVAFG